jgi:hypothetical protein
VGNKEEPGSATVTDLSKFRDGHGRKKSRGELFLADWLEKNRVTEADMKTLVQWWKLYRRLEKQDPLDPATQAYWFHLRRLERDIPHVFPEGDNNLLADMLRNVDLKRIRPCPSCGRWLYALDPRKKHCTPKCRDHFRMNTESYRERKRKDMCKLRRVQKEMKEAKERVKKRRALTK